MNDRVTKIIAGIFRIEQAEIALDRELMSYGIDSARLMDLVVAIEDDFEVEISDEMMVQFKTANDIVRALENL